MTNPSTTKPLDLLGGLSAEQFMREYWQKKPLLVRQAIPVFTPLLTQSDLAELTARKDVESRYVKGEGRNWKLENGSFAKWPIKPSYKQDKPAKPQIIEVRGVDVLHDAVHALMQRFRFVSDARLDGVMVSYANVGGSVGAHFDSYDVFLLQGAGRREWRIAEQDALDLLLDMPLEILAEFEPEQTWVLEPGDMLYLPPQYAQHGVALDDGCQTYSIGFRAPEQVELASDMAQRLSEWVLDEYDDAEYTYYRDAEQAATEQPARIPDAMHEFAQQAMERMLQGGETLQMLLGEWLTEPKAQGRFEADETAFLEHATHGVALHRATRMMYGGAYIFANGESWKASGDDAALLQQLADARCLSQTQLDGASDAVRELLNEWLAFGWLLLSKDGAPK